MVLVNFTLKCLGTEVSCDKVCSDGYEPENLLCPGRMVWNQPGFMAERFLKPPVTLTFKLPCPVHLKSIIINPRVGSQRSSAIEIYSAADCITERSAASSVTSQTGPSSSQNRTDRDHPQTEPILKRIGIIRCTEPGQICFYNPRFRGDQSGALHHTSQSYPHCSELRHHQAAMLAAVDLISVRIVGTANSSVPAIGKLEIWGLPARAYPQRLELIQKYISAVSPQMGTSESSVNHQTSSSVSKNQNVKHHHDNMSQKSELFSEDGCKPAEHAQKMLHNAQNSNCVTSLVPQKPERNSAVEIPEQFLDAVTQEIMSVPMILPSGQCVDMSTLDRFFEEEANYGRQPSDPFTGLSFTAFRKPELNTALKIYIDSFLAKHADEPSLHGVHRTVGHARRPNFSSKCNGQSADGENDQTSCSTRALCWGSKVSSLKRGFSRDTGQHSSQTSSQQPLPDYITSKGAQSVGISPPAYKRMRAQTDASGQSDSVTPPAYRRVRSSFDQANTTARVPTNQSQMVPSTKTSQEQSRSNLFSSPIAALAKLPFFRHPSYQSRHAGAVAVSPRNQCSRCKAHLKQTDVLTRPTGAVVVYKFPCHHLVCRTCLIDGREGVSSDVTCNKCGKQFARFNVVRTHI